MGLNHLNYQIHQEGNSSSYNEGDRFEYKQTMGGTEFQDQMSDT